MNFFLQPLVALLAWLPLAHAQALTPIPDQLAAAKPAARTGPANAPVSLNFNNAEIAEVARTIAVITGRQVVVDPRVRGTVTLNTDKPVSPLAAYDLFLGMLRLQGFAVVQTAGLYKVVPEADAKLQGNELSIASPSMSARTTPANQIMTQVFNLNFENANALLPVLRPLISPNNTINVSPGGNGLVITDYSENLQRLARLIAALDMPSASELEIIPLRHAIAADVAPLVLRLLDAGGGPAGAGEGGFKTTVLADSRGNSVIVRAANPARTALAKSLIARLDQPSSAGGANGNIHVVSLKNADATKLAVTLRAALAGGSAPAASALATASNASSSPGMGGLGASGASAGSATGGQIQADAATNSLIITAPEPVYRQLRAVIDLLDGRRAQVFVESLIAEVNADKAAQFGIQWQGAFGNGANRVGVLGTNFGSGGNNLLNLTAQATGAVLPGTGLNFSLVNRGSGLGFLARFLEESGDGNILSTPNLLTLDNEEAKIVIGQNVPFVTGQFTNTSGGNGAVNPFQTIERKDVGLTLRVRPQISENGSVKLQVFQEVSSVQASSINAPSGLITNKRSIESSVMVEDGSIVVLGGLLQDEYAANQEQVPGLSSLPLFGNLFKAETRSRKKTNLMVFLRPVVVRNAESSQALSLDRYELMRGVQQQTQPVPSNAMPIQESPVLPELPSLRVSPRMAAPVTPAPKAP